MNWTPKIGHNFWRCNSTGWSFFDNPYNLNNRIILILDFYYSVSIIVVLLQHFYYSVFTTSAQRAQSVGCALFWPTVSRWIQQRSHFSSSDGATTVATPVSSSFTASAGAAPFTMWASDTITSLAKPSSPRVQCVKCSAFSVYCNGCI